MPKKKMIKSEPVVAPDFVLPELDTAEDVTKFAGKTSKLLEKVHRMGERSGKLRLYTGANGVDLVRQMIGNMIRPDLKATLVSSEIIKVQLTQDHINHGTAESCFWCPWALALEDATGQPWFIGNKRAVKCPTEQEQKDRIRVVIELPDDVQHDIHYIDGRRRMDVKPHAVSLIIRREALEPDMTLKTSHMNGD